MTQKYQSQVEYRQIEKQKCQRRVEYLWVEEQMCRYRVIIWKNKYKSDGIGQMIPRFGGRIPKSHLYSKMVKPIGQVTSCSMP